MEEGTLRQQGPQTAADFEAAVELVLKKIEQVHERMAQDQLEIDRLRSETRKLLSELKAA